MRNLLAAIVMASAMSSAVFAEDTVFADFEGNDYGEWKTSGTAFGNGPAHGTLPNQMAVSGYKGRGLVNSYRGGDNSVGVLTSPEFQIEKPYINFLIGGGGHDDTVMELLVDGKAMRSARGENVNPGGSEVLRPDFWDVSELTGKKAVIRITDRHTGGWGHINVDHIVFSDRPATRFTDCTRTVTVDASRPYLWVPIKNGGEKFRVELFDGGKPVHYFDAELATTADADWQGTLNLAPHAGKNLRITVKKYPEDGAGFAAISMNASPYSTPQDYREARRAQFHFQPRHGWNNDPNGLSFFKGEWHLFFQYNPYGRNWGNMHWGHTVSKDLVHWRELDVALYQDKSGMMFSGSAAVDRNNTAGFGKNAQVLIYTATGGGSTQCLAYSLDGRNYTKYAGNPVVGNITAGNRDPKIFWYQPSGQWVLVLYINQDGYHTIGIFNSPNLKDWTRTGTIRGDKAGQGNFLYECPDLFELPVDGGPETRWVVFGASGAYAVGTFDGKTFAAEAERLPAYADGAAYYAAQSFSDAPDGRRILVPWMHLEGGASFNQGMGLPQELGLKRTAAGIRLTHTPARELAELRDGNAVPFENFSGELVEAIVDCRIRAGETVGFKFRGVPVSYDSKTGTLAADAVRVAWPITDGQLKLTVYLDRVGMEIFSADGLNCLPLAKVTPNPANVKIETDNAAGMIENRNRAYQLNRIW
ncbi:MAG: glycoside hydrolase family 32 protein [Kiritimatiellae bacterium]|nr:glycoside hydrolase family 32 protein [Kiritimatiellia bacterium]